MQKKVNINTGSEGRAGHAQRGQGWFGSTCSQSPGLVLTRAPTWSVSMIRLMPWFPDACSKVTLEEAGYARGGRHSTHTMALDAPNTHDAIIADRLLTLCVNARSRCEEPEATDCHSEIAKEGHNQMNNSDCAAHAHLVQRRLAFELCRCIEVSSGLEDLALLLCHHSRPRYCTIPRSGLFVYKSSYSDGRLQTYTVDQQ